mgnify:CR=1 FL=1
MNPTIEEKHIYFGGGCFWCIEAVFQDLKGVVQVENGYAGGDEKTANYKSVSSGKTKHAEICKITYNENIISIDILLKVFFLAHDPTQLNKQGNDIGTQYRSIIFYNNLLEKKQIDNYIKQLENEKVYKNIQTEIVVFNEFYKAEEYHQDYLNLNPNQPYCSIVINPKIQKLKKKLKDYYN